MLIEHWSLIQISRLLLIEWLPGWVSLSSTAQHRSRESKQRARTGSGSEPRQQDRTRESKQLGRTSRFGQRAQTAGSNLRVQAASSDITVKAASPDSGIERITAQRHSTQVLPLGHIGTSEYLHIHIYIWHACMSALHARGYLQHIWHVIRIPQLV